jgi:hypothetical protein
MGRFQGLFGLLLIVIIAAVFAMIMWWAIRQSKNHQDEIEAQGFQRWPAVHPHFVKSVCSLAAYPYPERLVVEQAFRRVVEDTQLVIYDLVVKFGGQPGRQRYKIAVYKPNANFPIIRVIPKIEEFDGITLTKVGGFTVNNLVEFALKQSKEVRLDFSGQPDFDKRFTVTTPDQEHALSILTSDRLTQISKLPVGVMLQFGGGVILVDKPGVRVGRGSFRQHISEMADLASQVGQILHHSEEKSD